MKILVDTTVWSVALRRRSRTAAEDALVRELDELVRGGRAVLAGPVRQEVLSGIHDAAHFETVKRHLEPFEDLAIERADWEAAAALSNKCRRRGIQGSHIDFLLCAVSLRHDAPVFTTDLDFTRYHQHLGLRLHHARSDSR